MAEVLIVISPLIYSALTDSGFFMIRTSVMKELRRSSLIILQKSVLTCGKAELAFSGSFFYQGFFFRISSFTGQQGKGEAITLTLLYHFHALYRRLNTSQVIAAESLPLRIAGSQTQIRELWFFLSDVAKH